MPKPRPDVSSFALDDELVVYDPVTGESFILNQTGRLVWERCDGQHTSAMIADEIATLYSVSRTDTLNDVRDLLATFVSASLLDRA